MRVWDIHPGYLDRGGLLGQHAEIHAIWSVLRAGGGGYSRHPEVLRWRGYEGRLAIVHEITVREMDLRGFGHASPLEIDGRSDGNILLPSRLISPGEQLALVGEKLIDRGSEGRIPLPTRISQYWAHHKYSIMARGYHRYREVSSEMGRHPDLVPTADEGILLRIMEEMVAPITPEAMRNTLDHLWGYLKGFATVSEREEYLGMKEDEGYPGALDALYRLAARYEVAYLLHSSVFADAPFRGERDS